MNIITPPTTSRLELPDVTLVMVETLEHKLAKVALQECLRKANFGDVLIMTDKPEEFDALGVINQFVAVPNWPSKLGWSICTWTRMPQYVRTSHALCIQWDSWIWEPHMWSQDFLQYDIIGAPWWYKDGKNVGNLGFGLRSKRIMQHIIDNQEYFPCISSYDDDLLCRSYRPALEEKGFVWAPEDVAHNFAFECCRPQPDSRHFGFHGIFNWPHVLDRTELFERLKLVQMSPYITNGWSWVLFKMLHPLVINDFEKQFGPIPCPIPCPLEDVTSLS